MSPLQILDAHIAQQNAAFEAAAEARGATFIMTLGLTAADFAKMGIFTIDQFEAWSKEIDAQEAAKDARKNY